MKSLIQEFEDKSSDAKYDILAANLMDSMVEEKVKFQSSFSSVQSSSGEACLDNFIDSSNPWNKTAHPALPKVMEEQMAENQKRGRVQYL